MNLLSLIILFSLIGGLFSLIGAVILLQTKKIKGKTLIHLVIFSAGALLGAGLLNIMPEAFEKMQGPPEENIVRLTQIVLFGMLIFFVFERLLLRFHGHGDHGNHHDEQPTTLQTSPTLLVLGDSIHNFLDGIAIAASFLVSVPVGIVTSIAVAAHEIPSEIGEFSVMLRAGWKRTRVLMLNASSAFMTVVGALITYVFRDQIEGIVGDLLAFTAGIFIYIALSDLIPEIHHQTRKDSAFHVLGFLLFGIAIVRLVSVVAESFAQGI